MARTFSLRIKDELARLDPDMACCASWELLGILRSGGVLEVKKTGLELSVSTESPAVARRVVRLMKRDSSLKIAIAREPRRIHAHDLYKVRVHSQPQLKQFLVSLGFLRPDSRQSATIMPRRWCCRRSYLRGVFLGAGSISDPDRSYHLELVAGSRLHAIRLLRVMEKLSLSANRVERKGRHVVYLKHGDRIAAFLTLIGAAAGRLEFENIRVLKEMRNEINRLMNFDTANVNKTVEAACRQQSAISYVVGAIGLGGLPEPLQDIARLRLEYPEATLKELGQLLDPPLGKSGVNHRMRKIERIAAELRAAK